MGCCSSLLSGPNVDPAEKALEYELSDLKIEELMEFMAAVDLGWPEIDRIHAGFNIIDTNNDGVVDLSELLDVLGVDPSAFAAEVFRVFDRNEDHQIDFVEFVEACTRMCCASRNGLAHFAFRMVDADGSGSLSRSEVDKVVAVMYGACVAVRDRAVAGAGWHMLEATQASAGAVLAFADVGTKDGRLSVDEFVEATVKIPQVVEPAFRLQHLLRHKVVGLHFWAQREEDLRRRFNARQRDADAHGVQGDWWGRYASKFGVEPEDGSIRHRRGNKIQPFRPSFGKGNSRDEEVARGPQHKIHKR